MSYGFVYILTNEAMPEMFKIGCTERSPHQRAQELSSPTAIPVPFDVLCYAEFADFQSVERKLHEWLDAARVSDSREFFYRHNMYHNERLFAAIGYLRSHPSAFAFTSCNELLGELGPEGFDLLPNPWKKPESNVVELKTASEGNAA